MYFNPSLRETLNIWDSQLVSFGSKIIERRIKFAEQLNEIIYDIHYKLSGGKEKIKVIYEPDVSISDYEEKLRLSQEKDIKLNRQMLVPTEMIFHF